MNEPINLEQALDAEAFDMDDPADRDRLEASATDAGNNGPTVSLLCASGVKPEAIKWIWTGWLAEAKMQILGGTPGTGKTSIAMNFAATISTGGRWPDGTKSPVGNVIIWSGEDAPADTLVPRLILAGADLDRIYFVDNVICDGKSRSFDPAKDIDILQRRMSCIGEIGLLIVDPIVSAIAGDSHKNAETRRGLQPLADLAAHTRCALLGITHLSKGSAGGSPLDRITGSLAFGAVPRVVMVAAKNQNDDGRILVRAKSNIGPDDGGFGYQFDQRQLPANPEIIATAVAWGAPLTGTARDLLAQADAVPDDQRGQDAAKAIFAKADADAEAALRESLLADILNAFKAADADKLSTGAMITALIADGEKPWATYSGGRPMTPRDLAQLLAPYKIAPRSIRIVKETPNTETPNTETLKGYKLADFADMRTSTSENTDLSVTPQQPAENAVTSVTPSQPAETLSLCDNLSVTDAVTSVTDAVTSVTSDTSDHYGGNGLNNPCGDGGGDNILMEEKM